MRSSRRCCRRIESHFTISISISAVRGSSVCIANRVQRLEHMFAQTATARSQARADGSENRVRAHLGAISASFSSPAARLAADLRARDQ
jgi:hypothetical protein